MAQIFSEANSEILSLQITGKELTSVSYLHPLSDYLDPSSSDYPVLCGDQVTLDAGTGMVHTAPAHGPDDYLIGINHNLDLTCQVRHYFSFVLILTFVNLFYR